MEHGNVIIYENHTIKALLEIYTFQPVKKYIYLSTTRISMQYHP